MATDSAAPLRPTSHAGLALGELAPAASGHVTGVTLDSRRVRPGDLYVALPGRLTHGARFAADAVARGAVAVFTDAEGAALAAGVGVPVVVVADPRLAMAEVAARVYGRPSAGVPMFGVTGTNGKTSTVHLLDAALTGLGLTVATLGTNGFQVGGQAMAAETSTITTPESPDLQALVARMVEAGAQAIAMEVSSHALDLHRVAAIDFDVAAFTMLGRDHLEHHHTMEAYFAAKASLFTTGSCGTAVVTVDDPWGARLAELVRADGRARLVTLAGRGETDYRIDSVDPLPDGGSRVGVRHPRGHTGFTVSMLGAFNVRNALTALAMAAEAGHDVDAAAAGLATAQVPGRMQRVAVGEGAPHVVVDFAHTPQAIAAALDSLPRTGARIAVVGAGGDRDKGKREAMGAAAAAGADVVIVTDDNPRSEDPAVIRAAVLAGARSVGGREVVEADDRRAAIALALRTARVGDWVAILGKGHERGQEIDGVVTPFDDVSVVKQTWQEQH